MYYAHMQIRGITPYQQRKQIFEERETRETANDFEKRIWRKAMHVDGQGCAYIPHTAWEKCFSEAARRLKIQVPGRGKETYIKCFEAGLECTETITLGKADEAQGILISVPSDGKRGGGTRVGKYFPTWEHWGGDVTFLILDDLLTTEIFERHARVAGLLVGIGVWRPEKRGKHGKFAIEKLAYEDASF